MPVHLEPFDPSRAFRALRWFRWNGQIVASGKPFPPAGSEQDATDYNTRILYENRYIGYAPETAEAPAPAPEPARKPFTPPAPDPVEELVAHHTHAELLDMAAGLDVKKSDTKTEIARALVESGHGTA